MKNKKTIIVLLLAAIIGIVGLTIAYFANSTSINNLFSSKEYGNTYTESFVSPDNWLPGDTTEKNVVATNSGQIDQAVRIKVEDIWTTDNNGTLNGWIHSDGTKSNHTTEQELETDERVAILNLANTSDWTKVGDYYYYNYKLAPGESTSSFLESVTFNPKTKLDDTCSSSISSGTRTITCNSSGSDYDDATYTLTLTIETVQYNKYATAWGTGNTVTILDERPVPGAQYLIDNATNSVNAEYNNDTKSKMFAYNHAATSQTPAQTDYRYIGDNPSNYVYFNCDDMSDQSVSTCEVWRILGLFDVDDGTGNVKQRIKLVRGSDFVNSMRWNTNGTNDWTNASLKNFLNGDYYNRTGNAATYGLKMSAKDLIDDSMYYLGGMEYDLTTHYGSTEDVYALERGDTTCGACNSDITKLTWTGKVGLMYPSDEYMVYGKGVNDNCYNDPSVCYSSAVPSTGWIYNSNKLEGRVVYPTWLLSSDSSDLDNVVFVDASGYLSNSAHVSESRSIGVRPVVYLSSDVYIIGGIGSEKKPYKLSLNNSDVDTEQYKNYKSYVFGEKVVYDNNYYYVIEDSDSDTRYVSLLKEELLTSQEVNEYSSNYTSINGEYPYYETDNCNSSVQTNCSVDYYVSDVKFIVDNWANQYDNDLVRVNGLKARLLTEDIFKTKLGYESYYDSPHTCYRVGEDTLEWAYFNGKSYWAMSRFEDGSSVYGIGSNVIPEKVYNKLYIRPVINLNKCALPGGCWNE